MDARQYVVTQTRAVTVNVIPDEDETYEQAALRVGAEAFQNPGDFQEGMNEGMVTMPAIVNTSITRSPRD